MVEKQCHYCRHWTHFEERLPAGGQMRSYKQKCSLESSDRISKYTSAASSCGGWEDRRRREDRRKK